MHNPDDIPKNVYPWVHFPVLSRKADLCSVNMQEWERMEEPQIPTLSQVDLMVRVVLFMCSPASKFYAETDYPTRLRACLDAASVPPRSPVAALIQDHHWWYLRVVNAYMMLFTTRQFQEWLSSRVALSGMFEVLMSNNLGHEKDGVKGAVKAKRDALDAIADLTQSVDAMEARLFPMSELADYSFQQQMFDMENTAEHYAETWENF